METKVLEKDSKLDGGKVIVTKTVEETLTKQDLLQQKQNLGYQMQHLLQQTENLKNQINEAMEKDKEIDELIALIDSAPVAE